MFLASSSLNLVTLSILAGGSLLGGMSLVCDMTVVVCGDEKSERFNP